MNDSVNLLVKTAVPISKDEPKQHFILLQIDLPLSNILQVILGRSPGGQIEDVSNFFSYSEGFPPFATELVVALLPLTILWHGSLLLRCDELGDSWEPQDEYLQPSRVVMVRQIRESF